MIITEILLVTLQIASDNMAVGAISGGSMAVGGGIGSAIAKYQQRVNSEKIAKLQAWQDEHDKEHKKLEVNLSGTLAAIQTDIQHIKNSLQNK